MWLIHRFNQTNPYPRVKLEDREPFFKRAYEYWNLSSIPSVPYKTSSVLKLNHLKTRSNKTLIILYFHLSLFQMNGERPRTSSLRDDGPSLHSISSA